MSGSSPTPQARASAVGSRQNSLGHAHDPVFTRISRAELERRWTAVRAHMVSNGLDALVAQGFDDSLSGYVRWFCDFGASAYMKVAMFFRDGPPLATVEHGPLAGVRQVSPDEANNPGVARIYSTASFKSVPATFEYEAHAVAQELTMRGARRVGLLRSGAMPHAFVTQLREALPNTEFLDVTDEIDRLKAIKSSDELGRLREVCAIQDEVFNRILQEIRPGVREVDILALAEHEFRMHGAIDGTMASGSAPSGQPAMIRSWRAQNRVLQQGDYFTVLLEMSSDAGYYGELARQVVIGKAAPDLRQAFDVVKAAQAATVALFRPGAECAEIAAAHNQFMAAHGHAPESRLYSHSQGYDMVERPLIRRDETMKLEAGMFLSCHPVIVTRSMFVFLCDNFIIHEGAVAERVHRTPQEIFEV
jgi:Xaa-Pro aminopeptidase